MYIKTPVKLFKAVEGLKAGKEQGCDFFGIKYKKFKVWMELSLKDKRTKPEGKKKVMCSFRLSPDA